MRKIVLFTSFLVGFACIFMACVGCGSDPKPAENVVNVRLETDVETLNPFLTNNANAVQVYTKIFLTLADIDPKTLELKPLLIKNLPVEMPIDSGVFKGGFRYEFEILPEVAWDNGQPVTGHDFVFTVKTALLPQNASAIWRGYYADFIGDIVVDAANPKRFSVLAKSRYMLAAETLTGTPILPEYAYDPSGVLKKYMISDLLDVKKMDAAAAASPEIGQFAEAFKSPLHGREPAGVVGCGPYKLDEMVAGQRIALSKKANWWGDKLAEKQPLLAAFPAKIVYKPLPDLVSSLTLLKDGGLDVMKNIPAAQFDELKKDPAASAKLDFHNPELMEYSYAILNTRRPVLADKRVRRALAHCLDLDAGVQGIMGGYGRRAVGPFHWSKPYYNKDLSPIAFNLEAAKTLLAEAGWADSDKNGVVEKLVNGKKTELSLGVLVSPKSEVGKSVALQLQTNAQKVGIKIEAAQKDMQAILTDIKTRDFDIAFARSTQAPLPDDPYQAWHTKNNVPDGGNRSGFGSAASDALIDEIRSTRDLPRRNDGYRQLAALIYDEQPYIFLYAPVERIAVNKKWEAVISNNRPGYFEQLFRLK